MNILLWLLFGALAGWLGSILAGTNHRQGAIGNIVTGVVGAFVGGAIFTFLGGNDITGFNLYSLLVATVGATVLIGTLKAIRS